MSSRFVLFAVVASIPLVQSCPSVQQEKVQSCAQQCARNEARATCVSDCLKQEEVPDHCAHCLGTQLECGRQFCGNECKGNSSDLCTTCLETTCSSCSQELSFQTPPETAGTPNRGHAGPGVADSLATLFATGAPAQTAQTGGAVELFAKEVASCATTGSLLSGCGTPCYRAQDPAGCYAKCSMRSCFRGCSDCGMNHCFLSCRRSVSSFECATCISGYCGGCSVSYAQTEALPESQAQVIFP